MIFKLKKDNYAHVVEAILGKKAGLTLHITFILATFGVFSAYLIILASLFPPIIIQLGVEESRAQSSEIRT